MVLWFIIIIVNDSLNELERRLSIHMNHDLRRPIAQRVVDKHVLSALLPRHAMPQLDLRAQHVDVADAVVRIDAAGAVTDQHAIDDVVLVEVGRLRTRGLQVALAHQRRGARPQDADQLG